MSLGKARAAVPALAVVAGGQSCPPCGGLAGLGAYLARRGRFRDRWRRFGWWLVYTLAAFRWRWPGLDWWRVVLAAVAVRAAPVSAVAVAGAPVKRARRRWPLRAVVALRWWRGQFVKERARLALLALSRVVAVAGVEPAPLVAVLQWSRPWPLRAVVVSPLYWRYSP